MTHEGTQLYSGYQTIMTRAERHMTAATESSSPRRLTIKAVFNTSNPNSFEVDVGFRSGQKIKMMEKVDVHVITLC